MIVDGIESKRWRCVERALFEIFDDGVGWAAPHAAHMLYGSRRPADVNSGVAYEERVFFDRARELHR